jgi:hypothetical protein
LFNSLKGIGPRDRMQIFRQKKLAIGTKLETLRVFEILRCSADEMSSRPFPTRFSWKYIEEIIFIGEVSTLCDRCCLLLVKTS